jgi:hypothetical protein
MSKRNFVQNFNDVHFKEEYNNYDSLGTFKEDYNTIDETKIIFFNTKDVNYLTGDNSFNFSIYFTPGNNELSSINRNFKNVKKINLVDLVIKDCYIDTEYANYLYNKGLLGLSNNIRLERLSDLPYLILEITDVNNLNFGTNNHLNKSSFILKYDDDKDIRNNSGTFITYNESDNLEYKNINNSLLPETNNKMLYYKVFGDICMEYLPSPMGTLKNMKICLKTPYGNILSKMNNYLTISSIIRNHDNLLQLNFTEYFSTEEYSIGDKILIKNLTITGILGRKYDVETYLNNMEGLTILKHNNNLTSTKMFKSLSVSFKNEFLKDSSISYSVNTYNEDDFLISNVSDLSCTGTLINMSQQMCIGLEITSEIRNNSLLHGNII